MRRIEWDEQRQREATWRVRRLVQREVDEVIDDLRYYKRARVSARLVRFADGRWNLQVRRPHRTRFNTRREFMALRGKTMAELFSLFAGRIQEAEPSHGNRYYRLAL